MSGVERPGSRDSTARWQTYADWLEGELEQAVSERKDAEAEVARLTRQLAATERELRYAAGLDD